MGNMRKRPLRKNNCLKIKIKKGQILLNNNNSSFPNDQTSCQYFVYKILYICTLGVLFHTQNCLFGSFDGTVSVVICEPHDSQHQPHNLHHHDSWSKATHQNYGLEVTRVCKLKENNHNFQRKIKEAFKESYHYKVTQHLLFSMCYLHKVRGMRENGKVMSS